MRVRQSSNIFITQKATLNQHLHQERSLQRWFLGHTLVKVLLPAVATETLRRENEEQ